MITQQYKRIFLLSISIMLATTLLGCAGKDTATTKTEVPNASTKSEHLLHSSDQIMEHELMEQEKDTTPSIEQVSMKDAMKFVEALQQQDAKQLAMLMAHAENDYTEADMVLVLEGFLLYFDALEELQIHFDANEQNDDHYIERFTIAGTKNGEERTLPFQVNYAKSQQWEHILSDEKREPLYNAPLIGSYPFAVLDAERYIQALQQKDKESIALHLGMYDNDEHTEQSIEQLLQTYSKSLDLSSVEIISKGYDEHEDVFLFELQDDNQKKHEIRVNNVEYKIADEWVVSQ